MAGIAKQIIGSFETIAENVGQEVAKVPGDLVGKALETLGTPSSKPKQQVQAAANPQAVKSNKDSWDTIDAQKDTQTKQAVARQALSALLARKNQKEPSVWERLQQEAEQKKDMKAKQQAQANASALPTIVSKKSRGEKFGMKAKQNPGEIGKNVKSD
jgi:hypothetical protein